MAKMSDRETFDFGASVEKLGLSKNSRVLVAYSGGPDSTFLLLNSLRFFGLENVEGAYVDYHDSPYVPQEEKIICQAEHRYGFKLNRLCVHLPYTASGFEEKARKIRYRFFAKLVHDMDLAGVLVAHQENDDAETYLMQKARHGIVDTYGLAPVTTIAGIKVYRPLLSITKSEIERELMVHEIPYFDDPTNRNPSRKRDRLRMGILAIEENVTKAIEHKERDQIRNVAQKKKARDFLKGLSVFKIAKYKVLSGIVQRRVFHQALDKLLKIKDSDKIESYSTLCREFLKSSKPGKIELTKGIFLYKSNNDFFFAKDVPEEAQFSYRIEGPGAYDFEWATLNLSLPALAKVKAFPVFLRNVKREDEIGTHLVTHDPVAFMKKQKVPFYLKKRYPALYDQDGKIIYIPFYEDIVKGTSPIEPKSLPAPISIL